MQKLKKQKIIFNTIHHSYVFMYNVKIKNITIDGKIIKINMSNYN